MKKHSEINNEYKYTYVNKINKFAIRTLLLGPNTGSHVTVRVSFIYT